MTALETLSVAPMGYEAKDRVAGEPPEFRGLDVPLFVDFLFQHIHGVCTEDGKLVIGVENVAWNTGMVDASRVEQSEVKLVARAATHLAALQKLGGGYLSADAGRLMGELAGDSAFLLNSNPWKKRDVESEHAYTLNLVDALSADPAKLLNTRSQAVKERSKHLQLVARNAALAVLLIVTANAKKIEAKSLFQHSSNRNPACEQMGGAGPFRFGQVANPDAAPGTFGYVYDYEFDTNKDHFEVAGTYTLPSVVTVNRPELKVMAWVPEVVNGETVLVYKEVVAPPVTYQVTEWDYYLIGGCPK